MREKKDTEFSGIIYQIFPIPSFDYCIYTRTQTHGHTGARFSANAVVIRCTHIYNIIYVSQPSAPVMLAVAKILANIMKEIKKGPTNSTSQTHTSI